MKMTLECDCGDKAEYDLKTYLSHIETTKKFSMYTATYIDYKNREHAWKLLGIECECCKMKFFLNMKE